MAGEKTWEMRSTRCKYTGTIALIQSKSGTVVGVADVVACHGPLSREQLKKASNKHQGSAQTLSENFNYPEGRVFAWELKNARRLDKPVRYKHPSGAVIWVNLDNLEKAILSP